MKIIIVFIAFLKLISASVTSSLLTISSNRTLVKDVVYNFKYNISSTNVPANTKVILQFSKNFNFGIVAPG